MVLFPVPRAHAIVLGDATVLSKDRGRAHVLELGKEGIMAHYERAVDHASPA